MQAVDLQWWCSEKVHPAQCLAPSECPVHGHYRVLESSPLCPFWTQCSHSAGLAGPAQVKPLSSCFFPLIPGIFVLSALKAWLLFTFSRGVNATCAHFLFLALPLSPLHPPPTPAIPDNLVDSVTPRRPRAPPDCKLRGGRDSAFPDRSGTSPPLL